MRVLPCLYVSTVIPLPEDRGTVSQLQLFNISSKVLRMSISREEGRSGTLDERNFSRNTPLQFLLLPLHLIIFAIDQKIE